MVFVLVQFTFFLRSAKEKFPTNKAAFDKHIKAVLAKGKDKMQVNTIDEQTVVAHAANLRSDKGKAVMVLSPKPRHGMSKRTKAEMKKRKLYAIPI